MNGSLDIYGQCSSRSAYAAMQSDLRATLSADKSMKLYFMDAQSGLELHYPHISEGLLHDMYQI